MALEGHALAFEWVDGSRTGLQLQFLTKMVTLIANLNSSGDSKTLLARGLRTVL